MSLRRGRNWEFTFGHTQHETLIGFPRRDVKETIGSLSLENQEEVWHGDTDLGLSIL